MEYGLIGERLSHSFSKEIHEKIEDYSYELMEVKREELDSFMKKAPFKAINVTIPYKEAVIEYLDDISDTAREIGAVNVIVNSNGRLYGDNTDFAGMKSLIENAGIIISGKKVLILGTGGTSKTAFAVAKSMGASSVLKVSRRDTPEAITYGEMYESHTDARVIINTTPCGMYPNADDVPVDIEKFPCLEGVIDAIYNPLRTRLVSDAKKRGIKAEGGLFMLCAQAVFAAEKFTGKTYPLDMTEKIYSEIYLKKQNIVLIGMPSSGKSTVGRLLAKELGMEFADTDDMIVKKHKISIPEIFSRYGEELFRDWEAECVREVSLKSGYVIATGGGAILRKESADLLRQNGRLYFLDRPLKDLMPTSDRPLAKDSDAIKKRYEERYPIYKNTADEIVDNSVSPLECAQKIIKLHSSNH